MEANHNINKLAGLTIKLAAGVAIVAFCWFFRTVLLYLVLAFVVSLIGMPIMRLLRRVRYKRLYIPEWVAAILTIVIIIGFVMLTFTRIVPMFVDIVRDATALNITNLSSSELIDNLNQWMKDVFPSLGDNFDVTAVASQKLKDLVSVSGVSGFVGSVASAVSTAFVGFFAVIFISFFFIKDDRLFDRIVCALVSDKNEASVVEMLEDVKRLLSRYFLGLVIEMVGIALIDWLGLWLIARLDFGYAVGIAFFAGVMNIIPYVGPLIGEVVGVLLGVILKLGMGAGLDVNVWIFALIILAVMLFAQFIDNTLMQPLIYSTSIKAHPLEIFLVLLMAGHIGGMFGMLMAIPAYTVLRLVAVRFFYNFKPIQRLVPQRDEKDNTNNKT